MNSLSTGVKVSILSLYNPRLNLCKNYFKKIWGGVVKNLCFFSRYRIRGDVAQQEPGASIIAIATVEGERCH